MQNWEPFDEDNKLIMNGFGFDRKLAHTFFSELCLHFVKPDNCIGWM